MAKAPAIRGRHAGRERIASTRRRSGFAAEYDVDKEVPETRLYSVAPVSTPRLSYLGQHVLKCPRSY